MRLFLRLSFILFAVFVLLLGLSLGLGQVLTGHGTLRFMAGVGSNSYQIFVDYDSQALFVRNAVNTPVNSHFAFVANEALYYLGSQQNPLTLSREITPILARWDAAENAILLAYRTGRDAVLAWFDPLSNEILEISRYENFLLGFGVMSPDGRYLLLREEGIISPIPVPKPMLLIDTETFTALDFGSPVFAYWSPDSQYLALGYKETERYESRVERYTIATGERLPYPVVASQEDTPFFYTNGYSSNGLLWSPDSQKLVVLNRDTESLYFLSADGSIAEVTGGRITPLRWSPDSRFLLGIGYANGEVGAFVVDAVSGVINRLQSPVLLQDALSDFAWSPDSQYVAVLTHSSGVLFEQRLVLYDTAGRLVGRPVELELGMAFASFDGTLQWAN